MREANRKVAEAERAIERWHDRLGQLEDDLQNAIDHQNKVERAYERLCNTGRINRDLLIPQCDDYRKVLFKNDQAEAYNDLCPSALTVEAHLYAQNGWTIAEIDVDKHYEYFTLERPLGKFRPMVDASWKVCGADANQNTLYITIRRERTEPFDDAAADALIIQHCDFIFERWKNDPRWREFATEVTLGGRWFPRHFRARVKKSTSSAWKKMLHEGDEPSIEPLREGDEPSTEPLREGDEPSTGPPD